MIIKDCMKCFISMMEYYAARKRNKVVKYTKVDTSNKQNINQYNTN